MSLLYFQLKTTYMLNSSEKIRKIVKLYIASINDILTIVESGLNSTVTFNTNKVWEEIVFASCIFSESQKESVDGTIYSQKIEAVMAGDDQVLKEQLEYYKNAKPIVYFEYDYGTSKIIGNKTNYCQLNYGSSSEEFITKHQLIFTRENYKPALFLSA